MFRAHVDFTLGPVLISEGLRLQDRFTPARRLLLSLLSNVSANSLVTTSAASCWLRITGLSLHTWFAGPAEPRKGTIFSSADSRRDNPFQKKLKPTAQPPQPLSSTQRTTMS